MRGGEAKIIILARDASDNTKKKFVNKAFYYKIPVYILGTMEELSKASATLNRAIFAVTDDGLAKGVEKVLHNISEERDGKGEGT